MDRERADNKWPPEALLFELERWPRMPGWPPAMVQAFGDTYSFIIKLRDGTIISFESAIEEEEKGWATLLGCGFERGLEVHMRDIIWAAVIDDRDETPWRTPGIYPATKDQQCPESTKSS